MRIVCIDIVCIYGVGHTLCHLVTSVAAIDYSAPFEVNHQDSRTDALLCQKFEEEV